MTALNCSDCASDPTAAPGRYCARFRCYCGHSECPAAAHYQQRRLFALFAQKGIADADQLSGMAHILGRAIESRTAMTADEYARVTDHLEQLPDAQAGDES